MFVKIIAFILLSIGGIVALGGIAAASGAATMSKVVIHTGDTASGGGITWFHILAVSMLCLVCWLTSKAG